MDLNMFRLCIQCLGSGNDGSGECSDCESTGVVGGKCAISKFNDYVEEAYDRCISEGETK